MKILHVVRTLDPRTGGPASVLRGLAGAQAAAGHQVVVWFEDAGAQEVLPLEGVTLINWAKLARGRRGLRGELDRLRPDVLHLHGVWCRFVWRAARLARQSGVPYFLSPHGALGRWSLLQKAWKKRLALALWVRPLLRAARALFVASQRERDELVELRLARSVALVPHGLTAEEVELSAARKSEQPRILFLGRLAEVKDPLLLVAAFETLAREQSEAELVIAGPDEGLLAPLRERVSQLPPSIRGRVQLPGPIYGAAKRAALRQAWVLCLPSRYESFGAVLMEALAQETAVVCSKECGFPEIEQAGAGTSVTRDAEALAAALSLYLRREEAEAAGVRGRKLVLARYLWSVQVRRYLEIYAEQDQ